ncbi:MAG TPA: MMPL family transporter, partial [Solirubrobacterales bacterium]|nr:MMPL family transporter [Solirubrobacterales bacterium]
MRKGRNLAARAGRWSAQHRKTAIAGWLVFVVLAVMAGGSIGTETLDDEDYGVGESRSADQALASNFPDRVDETVLVRSDEGLTVEDREFQDVIAATVAELRATDDVVKVEDPLAPANSSQISPDGDAALVEFEIPSPPDSSDTSVDDLVESPLATVDRLQADNPAFTIAEFGDASASKELSESFEEDFQRAEVTSLPITLIILLLAFGAFVAALVPLALAATAVAAAIGLLGPISQIWPVDEAASSVVLLIGLAVGVDYSMFYLRREREERARGRDKDAALEAAAATSGRAVLISGITVAIAMAGMYLAGASTFTSFASATILVAPIAVVGSLTVLPAILSKLGDRVNKGRVPFLRPEKRTGEPRVWSFVLDRVLRRPLVSLVVAGAVLVALAIPVLHIHTADSGVEGLPRSLEIGQTYDRMQAAFPGETFSADVVLEGRKLDRAELRDAVAELREVARESDQFQEPVTADVSPDGQLAVVEVPLVGTGSDERSMAAVEELREDVVPRVFGGVSSGEVVG